MAELTSNLLQFQKLGMFPHIYQSFNPLFATILTIIIPYTPLNLLLYMAILLIIFLFNPSHLTDQITYKCIAYDAVPFYEFSWKKTFLQSYYLYLFIAFCLNYDIIYHIK